MGNGRTLGAAFALACAAAVPGAVWAQSTGGGSSSPSGPAAAPGGDAPASPSGAGPSTPNPLPASGPASPDPNPNPVPPPSPGSEPAPVDGIAPRPLPATTGADAGAREPASVPGRSEPAAGKPLPGDLKTSRRVRRALERALPRPAGDGGAPGRDVIEGLEVTTRGGKTTLRGSVRTQAEKDAADAAAVSAAGDARNVDDRIIVK